MKIQVVIEIDEDGRYAATCPSLEGCYTQGDTFEEAIENITDVIAMCLREAREEGKQLNLNYPEVIAIKQLEIAV